MKKWLFILFLVLWLAPAAAGEAVYSDDFRRAIPQEDALLSPDTDLQSPEGITEDLKLGHILSYVFRQISAAGGNALKTLVSAVALVLLSTLLNRFGGGLKNQNLKLIFSFVASLTVALMCEDALRQSAAALTESIENMRVFAAACIPSFTVVMIAAGEGAGASVFSALMVALGEIGSLIAQNLMIPLLEVYLAIGVCAAVSDEYHFASIGKQIRKFVVWGVGLGVAGFRLVLKLQNGAASASDLALKKYIRAAVGGLVPMVGGTLSEGIEGLFTVAVGVKTSFAAAGVLIVLSIMLPVLIAAGINGLIWSLCYALAGFLQDQTVGAVADVLANGFYLMLALGSGVALMGVFSFAGLIAQGG